MKKLTTYWHTKWSLWRLKETRVYLLFLMTQMCLYITSLCNGVVLLVIMESPVQERATTHIRATAEHSRPSGGSCVKQRLHFGLLFWNRKGHRCKSTSDTQSLGDLDSDFQDILKQSTNFVAACYNVTGDQLNISSVRQ